MKMNVEACDHGDIIFSTSNAMRQGFGLLYYAASLSIWRVEYILSGAHVPTFSATPKPPDDSRARLWR